MFRSRRAAKKPIELDEADDLTKPFFRRNGRLILLSFWYVFFFGIVITIFQAPVYRSVAIVAPPKGSDVVAERVRLIDPELQRRSRDGIRMESSNGFDYTVRQFLLRDGGDGTGGISLAAESDDPDIAAAVANQWASVYANDAKTSGRGEVAIAHAVMSASPIRPKKMQGILFGGVLGLALGIVLSVLRDERRHRRWRRQREMSAQG